MSKACFVHMPCSLLSHPSMALSVLSAECQSHGIEANVIYGNMRFAALVGLKNYLSFNQYLPFFTLVGETLFKDFCGFTFNRDTEEYFLYTEREMEESEQNLNLFKNVKQSYSILLPYVDDFLEELSNEIINSGCIAVGCDITYEQRNASLALLKRVKEKKPEIVTMLGGNSCTGEPGQMLADYADYVDLVFSGEADDIIADVIKMIENGADKEEINAAYPSVLIKGSKAYSHARENLEENAVPDFRDFFAEIKRCGLEKNICPVLLIEGSRGCWWGEKHRCNFCGIHTSKETLCYRQKSVKKIVEELKQQAEIYNIKRFVFTDCILSNEHVNNFPIYLNENDGFHLFAEVKSNLTEKQIAGLKKAGFVSLQPGIESLQDDLLNLMNKGNRAIKHIEFLKLSRTYGIGLIWNLLNGVPFEKIHYYEEINNIIPWITHLHPPVRFGKIIFEKNSNYTQNPQKYNLQLKPLELYELIGSYGEEFIKGSAEYFTDISDSLKPTTKMTQVSDSILKNIFSWQQAFNGGEGDRLTVYIDADSIDVFDLRKNAVVSLYHLTDKVKDVFLAADKVISVKNLQERFCDITEEELNNILKCLEDNHLIIKINDEVLNLATPQPSAAYVKDFVLPVGKIVVGDE